MYGLKEVMQANAPFTLVGKLPCKMAAFDSLAEAAQEAELLHGTYGVVQVQDRDGYFVYTSLGAPE